VKNTSKIVLNSKEMDRALTRMAHEIIEQNKGIEDLALIGIRTGGVPLSERLQQRIAAIEGTMVSTGVLDITLYRDISFIYLFQLFPPGQLRLSLQFHSKKHLRVHWLKSGEKALQNQA